MKFESANKKRKYSDAGFAALFIGVLIMAIMLAIGLTIALLTLGQQRITKNISQSTQSLYTAEAGIEDALLRLSKGKEWQGSYQVLLNQGSTNVEISGIIGGSRTITSTGNFFNRIRKIQVVYQIASDQISFFYGAQVGDGGIEMENNSKIIGNVFSNGSINAKPPNVEIQGTVKVAGAGKRIKGAAITQD